MKSEPFAFVERALSSAGGDEAEVLFTTSQNALTRFTQNYIHQNMASESSEIQLRVIAEGKEGCFTTNRLDDESLKNAAKSALEIALAQPPSDSFPGLPRSRNPILFENASPTTERCTPAMRASMVKKIISLAKRKEVEAAGALSTRTTILVIANTAGIRAYQRTTTAELNLVTSRGELSGYAYWVGADIKHLPLLELAREAIEKTTFPAEPASIEPGAYTVVLSPYAVATLINYLAYIGLGAKAYLEKRSFMANLKGKKVASEKVSIYDNGNEPTGLPSAFDYEGVRKKKVYFIKRGIAAGVVHDSRTAALSGEKNTGHALPAPNTLGPFATNLFVAAGKTPSPTLLAGIMRGLYVTRFHYVNIVEPVSTVMTGMTRDGTFLIEGGKLTVPVTNLRFTQNILEALANVEAIGKERRRAEGFAGATTAPAMRIRNFHFTGVSNL